MTEPTHDVRLWLNNDYGSYLQAKEICQQPGGIYGAADALRVWVEEMNPLSNESNMYADLMSHVLNAVDWVDIAEGFREDYVDPEEEEDAS